MRLRLEFTTEPFDLDESPPHAVVAREVVGAAELEAVEVGPFGNTAEGTPEAVFSCVDALLRQAIAAGATRISLQVNALGASGEQDGQQGSAPAVDGGLPA
ncbi:thiamine-binding protein [Streptomyces profundus]|uniref:thiamine-binding protein n=1 Tax=Streptomyces profundus TaxID=2867410 RepID=UPI001D16929C|nr:thiamine-binding protein [Streptomyces sp. MA3_2.13]UED87124.1 thiamine-binding protein [Streptomyces sp. MA3_2.13]